MALFGPISADVRHLGESTAITGPGPQLLSNGSFEDGTHATTNAGGLTDWSLDAGWAGAQDDGVTEYRTEHTATDGTGYVTIPKGSGISQTLGDPLEVGVDYTFSVNAFSFSSTGAWLIADGYPTYLDVTDQDGNILGRITVDSTDYGAYEVTFTAPAGVTGIKIQVTDSPAHGSWASVIIDEANLAAADTGQSESGGGNDTLDGGDGDDLINLGRGDDTIIGGTGQDTVTAATSIPDETITVSVDNDGDGTLAKTKDGNTDDITSIEHFVAGEAVEEDDKITLTEGVADRSTITGLTDASVGTFQPDGGGAPIAFGPSEAVQLSDILGDSAKVGTFTITDGDEGGQVGGISFENFETIVFTTIPCIFISTEKGDVPIETLKAGDMIFNAKGDLVELKLSMSRKVSVVEQAKFPKLRPVLIEAGALGAGLPNRDLYVSRQHRMLLESDIAALMFGEREVLVAAIKLVNLPGVTVSEVKEEVEYFHLLFDDHEVIVAEGCATESLYLGQDALKSIPTEALAEIRMVFPEVFEVGALPLTSAYHIPSAKEQKLLVASLT